MPSATGSFEVHLAPVDQHEPTVSRMSLDKEFLGDLVGKSRGEMLAHRSSVQGSAGYVAMELVSGQLHGKTGTFVLQHSGTMNRGTPSLMVSVVPDSGTGELTGLSGMLRIIVSGKAHSYEFDYKLPQA